ncbi:MAG: hypothetical protein AAGH76_17180 [Pseudomonadota bacterium]
MNVKSTTGRRLVIASVYLILLVLAIPWYWPANDNRVVSGVPLWALTSLAVLTVTAAVTAGLCLRDAGRDD